MKFQSMLVLVALLAAACSSQSSNTSSNATEQPSAMAGGNMANPGNAPAGSITVAIHGMNGSGESGSATLTPMGNKTRVVIGLKGEPATGNQPAHVHKGTCANLNPAPAYPLKNVVLGKSNTVVDASIDKLTASPMAINVHESTKNLGKYVACGDIKGSGM